MDHPTLTAVTAELSGELIGRRIGRVFALTRTSIAIDVQLDRWLYLDWSPSLPRLYLIARRKRDIERSSLDATPFSIAFRRRLNGAEITGVSIEPDDRIVKITTIANDDLDGTADLILIAQMTGRSANVFICDRGLTILERARETNGDGQQLGETYRPPKRGSVATARDNSLPRDAASSASAALDEHYTRIAADRQLEQAAAAARASAARELAKTERLRDKILADLDGHGDADKWKRLGDILLANATAARRTETGFIVVDHFGDQPQEVEIEADAGLSATEAANAFYRRYTKARNAAVQARERLAELNGRLEELRLKAAEVESAISSGDFGSLDDLIEPDRRPSQPRERSRKPSPASSYARTFISSDGFEILVGKKAKDNDVLTFKNTRSLDVWMHAADYPGSHVVIRNPDKKDVPQRTMLEAARLAAFYSQGKAQTKAAVHHTLKKFVNKPKGAPPGLVSLASFKTLLVEPTFPDEVKRKDE